MGKILLLIIIGVVVYAIFRNFKRSLNQPDAATRESSAEDMVKCAHCHVNLPRSEAIQAGDAFYCTPEHQKLGRS